jgi:hypothetical protein
LNQRERRRKREKKSGIVELWDGDLSERRTRE